MTADAAEGSLIVLDQEQFFCAACLLLFMWPVVPPAGGRAVKALDLLRSLDWKCLVYKGSYIDWFGKGY